jgi:hypothetical protein
VTAELMEGAPTIEALRARVTQMQGRPSAQPVRTHPALSGLLQLQTGGSYVATAASLATLLLAGPSSEGAWCGVVGAPELGPEAAAATGVELSRTIWVPAPGEAWLEATAALVDVLGVVLVRPPGQPGGGDLSRLAARLRQRGSVLVVWGDWPRCDARLSMHDVEWTGLGAGHGHLRAREATVEVTRGVGRTASARLAWDAEGAVRQVEQGPAVLRSVG